MLDIVMIALLFIGFVSMKLLADWCGKQTEKKSCNVWRDYLCGFWQL